jgi:hypothetical protein
MIHNMVTHINAKYKRQAYQSIPKIAVEKRLDQANVQKQDQDEEQQHDIFGKRLPGCKFECIAKATAVGDLIEISRVESKEGKKHNHQ